MGSFNIFSLENIVSCIPVVISIIETLHFRRIVTLKQMDFCNLISCICYNVMQSKMSEVTCLQKSEPPS